MTDVRSTQPVVSDAEFPPPRLVVSQCLGFVPVRRNAQIMHHGFVQQLVRFCVVTVRDIPVDGASLATASVAKCIETDGFVLKNRSPSCSIGDVNVDTWEQSDVPGDTEVVASGRAVLERFSCAAIEEEGRLRNNALRERFLTLLFALPRLRAVEQTQARSALVHFHSRYKYTLLCTGPRTRAPT